MPAKPRKKGNLFRVLRTGLLLLILMGVAGDAWLTQLRSTDWSDPLWVSIYPINADGSEGTAAYIKSLSDDSYAPVEAFMEREAARYGVPLSRPMQLRLAPELRESPPAPPANGNRLAVMAWSLQMRYWSWRTQRRYGGPPSNIRVFVRYFDPQFTDRVAHSLGLQKGMIGVVNAFASRKLAGQNNVVIVHEVLHTLGATDKYDMRNSQPLFPEGYAEPHREPLYPQSRAEIMGGRIPLSAHRAELPMTLGKTLVGPETAAEIRWVRPAS